MKSIFEDSELSREATVAKYATVQTEGARQVEREIEYDSLEAIFAVGYRVRSRRGIPFRSWATARLKEYAIKGFVMDDERLKNPGGWENLKTDYSQRVDEWSIYDASRNPPRLIENGDNRTPINIMEDPSNYSDKPTEPAPVQPLDDPDFIGAEAALKRAAAKAVKRALDAGLEPVTADDLDVTKTQ